MIYDTIYDIWYSCLQFGLVFVRKFFVRNSRKSVRKFFSEVVFRNFSVRKCSVLTELAKKLPEKSTKEPCITGNLASRFKYQYS